MASGPARCQAETEAALLSWMETVSALENIRKAFARLQEGCGSFWKGRVLLCLSLVAHACSRPVLVSSAKMASTLSGPAVGSNEKCDVGIFLDANSKIDKPSPGTKWTPLQNYDLWNRIHGDMVKDDILPRLSEDLQCPECNVTKISNWPQNLYVNPEQENKTLEQNRAAWNIVKLLLIAGYCGLFCVFPAIS